MQQVGELILKDYLSIFETVINRKDLTIKALVSKVESQEKELKELKDLMSKVGLFLQDLGG